MSNDALARSSRPTCTGSCSCPCACTGSTAARRGQRGFTIIELAVVMLIIVVVIAGLAIGLGGLRRADLTTVTGRIDATIRYLYQLSAINATPYRLVIDMDSGKWNVEALEEETGACRAFSVRDVRRKDTKESASEKRKGRFGSTSKGGKDRKGDKGEADGPRCSEEERDADGECPKEGFVQEPSELLKARELPKGIKFGGVMTTHQQEVQEEGKAYVYFFPNGSAEKAYIYVSSETETFTIETFALLGKVRVHHEKMDLRDVLTDDDDD